MFKLQVSEDDGLSRWLCQSCVETVDGFITFIDVCKKTNRKYEPTSFKIEEQGTTKNVVLINDPLNNLNSGVMEDNEAYASDKSDAEKEPMEMVIFNINEHPPETLNAFNCNFCSKNFPNKFHLTRHMQTAHKNKRLICPQCPKSFSQLLTLTTHIKKKHKSPVIDVPNNQLKCDICQVATNSKLEMQRHVDSHLTNSKLFHCKICPDKVYTHSNNLSRHMTGVHQNVKHYCEQCGRCFTQRASLNEHIKNLHKSPLDKTTFECEICHKVLNTKRMYQQHYRRHEINLRKISEEVSD